MLICAESDDRGGDGELAESLARFILDADPAIAGVGAAERPGPSPSSQRSPLSALPGLGRPRGLPPSIPHQHQLPPGPSNAGEHSTEPW